MNISEILFTKKESENVKKEFKHAAIITQLNFTTNEDKVVRDIKNWIN